MWTAANQPQHNESWDGGRLRKAFFHAKAQYKGPFCCSLGVTVHDCLTSFCVIIIDFNLERESGLGWSSLKLFVQNHPLLHEHTGNWCYVVTICANRSKKQPFHPLVPSPSHFRPFIHPRHLLLTTDAVPLSASQEDCVLKIMLSCALLLEEHAQETFLSAQHIPNCQWWIQSFANTVRGCISYSHCHLHNAIPIWWLFYLCFPHFKAEEASSWSCEIQAPTSYWAMLFMGVISFYHPLGVRILSEW